MIELDKRYYERQKWHDLKKNRALLMANKRGVAAAKWFRTNKLTPETKPEFDKLMSDTNMEDQDRETKIN